MQYIISNVATNSPHKVTKRIDRFSLQISGKSFYFGQSQSPALSLTLQPPSVLPPNHPLFLLQLLSALFGPFDAPPQLSSSGAKGKILPSLQKERGKRGRHIFYYKPFQQTMEETLPGVTKIKRMHSCKVDMKHKVECYLRLYIYAFPSQAVREGFYKVSNSLRRNVCYAFDKLRQRVSMDMV